MLRCVLDAELAHERAAAVGAVQFLRQIDSGPAALRVVRPASGVGGCSPRAKAMAWAKIHGLPIAPAGYRDSVDARLLDHAQAIFGGEQVPAAQNDLVAERAA